MILKATCAHCRADFEVPVIDGHLVWDPELTAYRWETTCAHCDAITQSGAIPRTLARVVLTGRQRAVDAEIEHAHAILETASDHTLWALLTGRAA